MSFVFSNGIFLPEGEGVVSVNDRSFRFGDGVFETVAVFGGKIYQREFHVQRLHASLAALRISGVDASAAVESAIELIKKNQIETGFARIAISRGEGGDGYLPSNNSKSSIVITTRQRTQPQVQAAKLWLSSYKRPPLECFPANHKTANGLNSVLARMEARDNDCFEALLLNLDEKVCEGSSSNIFWVMNSKLYTPSAENGILCGAIRDAIIRVSPLPVVQGIFGIEALLEAEEIFLTNVSWMIMPVERFLPDGWSYDAKGEGIGLVARELNNDIMKQCSL